MEKIYKFYIEVHSVDSNINKDLYELIYPRQLYPTCTESQLESRVRDLIEDAAQVTTPDYFELEIGDIDFTVEKKELASLGVHLVEYMADNLHTVVSLAETLKIDRKTVYNILNGKSISKDTKRKIADLLGFNYNELPKEE